MKTLSVLMLLALLTLTTCNQQENTEDSAAQKIATPEKAALEKSDPAGSYGKDIHLTEATPISTILENPEQYEGKKVLVQGAIVDVCPMRGCWVDLASNRPDETIRVKVNDGEIVFPLSAKGNRATAEGIVEKIELSEEQHRKWKAHEAEEKGEKFDESSVQGSLTIWRIKGTGAKISG